MYGQDELKRRFYPQFLNPAGLAQIQVVREGFLDIATALDTLLADNSEKARMLDALQDASMYAVKSVCCTPEYWRTDEKRPKPTSAMKNSDNTWRVWFDDGSSIAAMEDWEFRLISEGLLEKNAEGKFEPVPAVPAEDPDVADFNRGLAEGLKGL